MGLSGTNLEHARGYNRRLVLEFVRLHGPLSRAQLARETGLSVQTVHNIVEDLAAADLVSSRRATGRKRGQPGTVLTINPEGGYTIGISFDHRRLVVVLVDLAGTQRTLEEHALDAPTPSTVLDLIEACVDRIAASIGARQRIWGAGVVIPALIDAGNLVTFGPSSVPQWAGYPLAEKLSQRLALPVFMENDATAAAVGEHLYGAGRWLQDFFYIYLGVGVGSGMIFAGHPYGGSSGRAGEFGHITVEPGGKACTCGNRGCLERYVSLSAAQAWLTGMPEDGASVQPHLILAALQDGNPRLSEWLDLAAAYLRQAVATVENLLDPEAIVIGGIMPMGLLDELIARMQPLASSVRNGSAGPRLIKAQVGLETPALGAAALPLFNGLTPSFKLLNDGERASPAVLRVS